MKRGQVYYANLNPAIGSEQSGVRPCVIIQNDIGNTHSPTVIVATMTTQKKNNLPTHINVSKDDCGIDIRTTILLEQIRTIDKSRLKDFVGRLSESTMQKVDEALHISLALQSKERKDRKMLIEKIHIVNTDILVKEYKGQRVVTFKDIDMVHGRPDGTAKRNFSENRERFIEGEDFFLTKQSDFTKDEIRTLEIPNRGLTFITEQGYLMLVKSLTDDLAWEVQRKLVNEYFRAKKLSQVEMMRIQLGMIDDHENRIVNLENNMTIDYGQQRVLEDTVNKTVIDVLGGKGSDAYKEVGRKVFAECNRDLKHYFDVNARNNVPKKRFEEAVEYAKNWKPCTNTMMMIKDCNAQMSI